MFKDTPPPPPFPIMESFLGGFRLCAAHARLILLMSFLPFVVTLATVVALRLAGDSVPLFWLPLAQLPAGFVTGLESALILRLMVLHEYPLIDDEVSRRARNRAVVQSGFIYAAVGYFTTGLYVAMATARQWFVSDPPASSPYAPLALALLILALFAVRWFWLHVPRALDWQTQGFYARLGGWGGSLRVFALFALCSLCLSVVITFVQVVIHALAAAPMAGFAAAFDDAAVAAGTLALAILFTACTAAAVRFMMKARTARP
ncbi:MAG: hypothetical protein H6865_04720 [Rhodospirillales bacterium]|nr:hypothetical protein [Alphaproteobacteria bacterium]MCB9986921.1 hypothetical protein [Rhodospirillales bacterium]USO08303.1 MAG: hypothetical protein H6866_03570 [Rhodospirillales bacterium]